MHFGDLMTASDNRFLKDFYSSVVFLTRFPAPPWVEAAKRPLATSMWAFPIVGVLIAAVGAATYVFCDLLGLPVFVAALFTVVTMIIATGGLHEDGLSDLADGVWGGADPRQRLSIMSDSRIGAYGTIALITSVGSRTAASRLSATPRSWRTRGCVRNDRGISDYYGGQLAGKRGRPALLQDAGKKYLCCIITAGFHHHNAVRSRGWLI